MIENTFCFYGILILLRYLDQGDVMDRRLIIPPRLEVSVLEQYADYTDMKVRDLRAKIDQSPDFAGNPQEFIAETLLLVTDIRDISARSLREWAIQWYLSGGSTQQISTTVKMSWNTIDKWTKQYAQDNNIILS